MSGAKRKTKYRKHVESGILEGLPEPQEGELICQVLGSRGGNMLDIMAESGESGLCILPAKFRKLVWVRRGNYIIASHSDEDYTTATGSKGKVKYTVKHILFREQVKHLQKIGVWPATFNNVQEEDESAIVEESNSELDLSKATINEISTDGIENESSEPIKVTEPDSTSQVENKELTQTIASEPEHVESLDSDEDEDEEDDILFVNRNRQNAAMFVESSSEEESEDGEEEEEDGL